MAFRELELNGVILTVCIGIFCYTLQGDVEKIGVVNGMMGNNLPSQEEVVKLMQSYNFGKYRTYKQEPTVLKAFANSGIEIMVGVADFELQNISSSQEVANKWVNDYIRPYYPATYIIYIAVGNEALGKNDEYVPFLVPAMKNIQAALNHASLSKKIKVSTALAMGVIGNSLSPNKISPSKVKFITSVKDQMTSVLQFLNENGSPLLANVFPYDSYLDNSSIGLDLALFKSSARLVRDGDLNYTNLFDAILDAFYSAMEDIGYSNISIVISATGWPSKGNGDVATIENAQTYNNNLIRHVLSNKGTPKRPGRSMETYIYSIFNENTRISGEAADHYYGLFYPSKEPVYSFNFSPFYKSIILLLYIEIEE